MLKTLSKKTRFVWQGNLSVGKTISPAATLSHKEGTEEIGSTMLLPHVPLCEIPFFFFFTSADLITRKTFWCRSTREKIFFFKCTYVRKLQIAKWMAVPKKKSNEHAWNWAEMDSDVAQIILIFSARALLVWEEMYRNAHVMREIAFVSSVLS